VGSLGWAVGVVSRSGLLGRRAREWLAEGDRHSAANDPVAMEVSLLVMLMPPAILFLRHLFKGTGRFFQEMESTSYEVHKAQTCVLDRYCLILQLKLRPRNYQWRKGCSGFDPLNWVFFPIQGA
jgi:hypothetical protein